LQRQRLSSCELKIRRAKELIFRLTSLHHEPTDVAVEACAIVVPASTER
jgi:hypothetical protein